MIYVGRTSCCGWGLSRSHKTGPARLIEGRRLQSAHFCQPSTFNCQKPAAKSVHATGLATFEPTFRRVRPVACADLAAFFV